MTEVTQSVTQQRLDDWTFEERCKVVKYKFEIRDALIDYYGESIMEDRKMHMFELAVLGVWSTEWEGAPSPFVSDDFRAALLILGAPIPRYHRGDKALDSDALTERIEYVEKCHRFCEDRFGTIGAHGSFVPRFIEAFDTWFTQCVKEIDSD